MEREIILNNTTAKVYYYSNFFEEEMANHLFEKLRDTIVWKQYPITIFGKTYMQPRLVAWHGDAGICYEYSNTKLEANGWTKSLEDIKHQIEQVAGGAFNSVLLNLYRNGQDSMGWHSDDEKELGQNPTIASVSFGAERQFQFRLKREHKTKQKVLLKHGSLLLMQGATQHHWQHQIAKTKKINSPRINLTFRWINK